MRASLGANDNTRADAPVSWPLSIVVIAVLSAVCWWAVIAIVGLALGLL
jgi:hypothetical protein